jgi:hypothetical protein
MKCCRFLFAAAVLSLSAAWVQADVISADRLPWPGTWQAAGVPGGVQQYRLGGANARTTIGANVLNYGADPTGVADCTTAFNNAQAACPANQVIYVPAGTYSINGAVTAGKNNVTWRGAGDSTIIKIGSGGIFWVGNQEWPLPSPTIAVTAGATKGSNILICNDVSSVVVGRFVSLTQLNPAYVHDNENFYGSGPNWLGHDKTRLMSIMFLAVSKNAGAKTVTLDHALPIDMTGTPMLTVWPTYCTKGVGFEDMQFDCTGEAQGKVIWMLQTYGCWCYNVHFHKINQRTVMIEESTHFTFEHCRADDSQAHSAGSEGLSFYSNCCWCLVQNNIFWHGGGLMIVFGEFGGGCVGNVAGYNYAYGQTAFAQFASGPYTLTSNHGPHNMFNLWEGNYAETIESDGYYGSESYCTILRNRLTGVFDPSMGYLDQAALVFSHWSTYFNVVGNVLGTSGQTTVYEASGGEFQNPHVYRIGYPNCGNRGYTGTGSNPSDPNYFDTNVAATLIRHANYDYATQGIVYSDSDHTIANSLYLTSKPGWFGNLAWPAFDPSDPSRGPEAIPAGYLYVNGTEAPGIAASGGVGSSGGGGVTLPPSNAKTQIQVH